MRAGRSKTNQKKQTKNTLEDTTHITSVHYNTASVSESHHYFCVLRLFLLVKVSLLTVL